MKNLYIILSLMSALIFSNCASRPANSRILELARPDIVLSPSTQDVEEKVTNVSKGVSNTGDKINEANEDINILEKQVIEGDKINEEFKEAINDLQEDKQSMFDILRVKYEELSIRSKVTINALKLKLFDAGKLIDNLKIEVVDLEVAVANLKADTARAEVETKKLRKLVDEMIALRVSDEAFKERAESRLKYVWFFWGLVSLVTLGGLTYILLKFQFGVIR